MMTCRKIIEFLDDYVAGALPPKRVRKFEKHLDLCPCCKVFLESYRQTLHIARDALVVEEHECKNIPDELVKAILASVEEPPNY